MDSAEISEILRISNEIKRVYPKLPHDYGIIGRMFHSTSKLEERITEITAARLGSGLVSLDWENAESKGSDELQEEAIMASHTVDLLLTAYQKSETFGEGHDILKKLSDACTIPVVSVADDLYHWQSAMAHLYGFNDRLGALEGKRIAVSWGFGSSFASPGTAHALLLAAASLGANVKLVAPKDFSLMGRVRKSAKKITKKHKAKFKFQKSFDGAFDDVDAVFASNWLRLDDYSHPDRFPDVARSYKDWFFEEDTIHQDCIFTQEPPLDSLLVSQKLAKSERSITSTYLSRRVRVLAASIIHATSLDLTDLLS